MVYQTYAAAAGVAAALATGNRAGNCAAAAPAAASDGNATAASRGGGEAPGDGEAPEAEAQVEAPQAVAAYFEPLPWSITTEEEMREIFDFKHRVRLTPYVKELLRLPSMEPGAWPGQFQQQPPASGRRGADVIRPW